MSENINVKCFGGILFALALLACTHNKNEISALDPLDKIQFNLSQLNENGCHGPQDGSHSISYEFCIPANESLVEEVTSIDSTLRIYRDSPGRIGCSKKEYLCVGNTHQKKCRDVLVKLARLEYIKKIGRTFFE